uniref:Neuroendocrine convertase 1 n=1 Tax=Lygus hesperus TaxID=30085 RepID=A0A146L5X9_LYGHE
MISSPLGIRLYLVALTQMVCGWTDQDVWVGQIDGGLEEAEQLAARYGFEIVSQLDPSEETYVLKRSFSPLRRDENDLGNEEGVSWIEKQIPLKRSKRQMFSWLDSHYSKEFNDALWNRQWYMQDYRPRKDMPVMDMNMVPCYREGITGKGVHVAVVDDGLEKDHADIQKNYDPEISFNYVKNQQDPTPDDADSSHGTQCAGVIAMVANNSLCGVGVAYDARIGGVLLLDGDVSDLQEGQALSHGLDKVDIYSCSWGPEDNGETMEGPKRQGQAALFKGISTGRGGKGAIYVFAGGNGKMKGDSCGADGFVNSLFTIAIASASQDGRAVYYSERCSAIMATAYSSGNVRAEKVASTGLKNTCTTDFVGTSAATPLAAGVIALALQANPQLTWRDVQHLIVWTSEVTPLRYNKDWTLNGRHFWVSPDFGFGLLNAHAFVSAARTFKTVPQLYSCRVRVSLVGNTTLSKGSPVNVKFATTGCSGSKAEVRYLEHVQVTALVPCTQRGALHITLTSPSGTRSILLEERPRDRSHKGSLVKFDWTMDSVQFWGEDPRGVWTFTVTAKDLKEDFDDADGFSEIFAGHIERVRVVMFGTQEMPQHYKGGDRKYVTRDGWGH